MPPVSFAAAFAAGVLSLLSPCVLALLPGYVAYLGGVAGRWPGQPKGRGLAGSPAGPASLSRQPLVKHALLFTLGFSLVFVAFGASASALGQLLLQHQTWVRLVAGALVTALGLHTLGVLPVPLLWRGYQWPVGRRERLRGGWQALVMGMAFAGGWTPCVGPILGAILTLAATGETLAYGVGLLAAYAAGMAVLFLIFALFLQRSRNVMIFLHRRHRVVTAVSGLLLVGLGLMLLTDTFSWLARYAGYSYRWLIM